VLELAANIENRLRNPAAQAVLSGAAVLGFVIGLDTLRLHLLSDPLGDVRAYYDAGQRLNAGLPLYVQSASIDDAGFYRYPPMLAIAFRPLALLPFSVASVVWETLLLGTFLLTVHRMGIRRKLTWLILGWLCAPIAWALAVGQAQVLVTYLMSVGTPLGIAVAAQLKVFPLFASVYWLGTGDVPSLKRLALWTVGLSVLSFLLEPANSAAYFGFLSLEQVGNIENRSLYALSPLLWALSVGLIGIFALLGARSRFGWFLAISLSIFAMPRLFMYQVSTLAAGVRDSGHRRSQPTFEDKSDRADDDARPHPLVGVGRDEDGNQ
jgi:hypothetical protein